MIYQILDLALAILVMFWLSWDMTRKRVGNTYRWGWLISIIIGYFFLHLFGIVAVIIAYYIWITFLRTNHRG